jgi:probable addiction module antidote protein
MDAETKKLIEKAKKLPKWDDFCIDQYRKNPEFMLSSIASELNEFEASGDIQYLLSVLKKVAIVKGWTTLEKETGVSRPTLYAALNGKSSPRIDTILKILKALGFTMSFKPIGKKAA